MADARTTAGEGACNHIPDGLLADDSGASTGAVPV